MMDPLAWLIGWMPVGVVLVILAEEFEVWYWPELERPLESLGDAFDHAHAMVEK